MSQSPIIYTPSGLLLPNCIISFLVILLSIPLSHWMETEGKWNKAMVHSIILVKFSHLFFPGTRVGEPLSSCMNAGWCFINSCWDHRTRRKLMSTASVFMRSPSTRVCPLLFCDREWESQNKVLRSVSSLTVWKPPESQDYEAGNQCLYLLPVTVTCFLQ